MQRGWLQPRISAGTANPFACSKRAIASAVAFLPCVLVARLYRWSFDAEFIHGESPSIFEQLRLAGDVAVDTAQTRYRVPQPGRMKHSEDLFETMKERLQSIPKPRADLPFGEFLAETSAAVVADGAGVRDHVGRRLRCGGSGTRQRHRNIEGVGRR